MMVAKYGCRCPSTPSTLSRRRHASVAAHLARALASSPPHAFTNVAGGDAPLSPPPLSLPVVSGPISTTTAFDAAEDVRIRGEDDADTGMSSRLLSKEAPSLCLLCGVRT